MKVCASSGDRSVLIEAGFEAKTPAVNDTLNLSTVMDTLSRVGQKRSELYSFCQKLVGSGIKEIKVLLVSERIRQDTATFQCVYHEKGKQPRSGNFSADFFPNQQQYVEGVQEKMKRRMPGVPHGALAQKARRAEVRHASR